MRMRIHKIASGGTRNTRWKINFKNESKWGTTGCTNWNYHFFFRIMMIIMEWYELAIFMIVLKWIKNKNWRMYGSLNVMWPWIHYWLYGLPVNTSFKYQIAETTITVFWYCKCLILILLPFQCHLKIWKKCDLISPTYMFDFD